MRRIFMASSFTRLCGALVLATLIATGLGGWFGSDLFPAGRYPQIILAIPGLIAGALGFFLSSSLLWNIRQSKKGKAAE